MNLVSVLLLIVIYIAFISLGLPDSLLGSAWQVMYGEIGVPVSYAGIISTVVAGGTIISSLLSSRLIRRMGTAAVTIISVLMTAAALFGFSLSGSFWSLCLLAVPLGLGAGSVDAALNHYVALHYKAIHMNWLHCFWGIGATIGPVIMAAKLQNSGMWQEGYRFIGILQFLLTFLLVISLPLWRRNKQSETAGEEQGKEAGFRTLIAMPGAKQALTAFFCYCAVEMTVGLWGSSYLVMVKGIPVETAAKWISLFYFGITAGRFLAGFVSLKLGNRQMIRLGLGGLVIGTILLLLPLGNAVLQAGFFFVGLGCAPIYPAMLHETPHNFGEEYSQAAMGVQMACAYVGTTLAPPVFGFIASFTGYQLFPFYTGALVILMILMTERLNYVRKSKIN